MQYMYDALHDGTLLHLEDLHAQGARERLWRGAAAPADHLHPLRHLIGRLARR